MSTKKEKYPLTESFEDSQIEDFKNNPDLADAFLRSCMEENDPQLFLVALRQVSKALGGIAKVAERTGLNREHLYKTLSAEGNPTWASVNAVVNSLGMRFMLEPIKPPRKKAIKRRIPTTRKSPQRLGK
jgi:probable addiction module antidote protein